MIDLQVEVRKDYASSPEYPMWRAIVTTARGRSYWTTYAGDRPSDEKVRQDYLADRGTNRARNWAPLY